MGRLFSPQTDSRQSDWKYATKIQIMMSLPGMSTVSWFKYNLIKMGATRNSPINTNTIRRATPSSWEKHDKQPLKSTAFKKRQKLRDEDIPSYLYYYL